MMTETIHEHTLGTEFYKSYRGQHWFHKCSTCNEYVDATAEKRSLTAKKAAESRKANDERYDVKEIDFEIGDILTGSWGYDQTNVEFYQVLSIKGRSITICEVERFRNSTGDMTEQVWPCKDQFIGQPMRKLVSRWGTVMLYKTFGSLRKWDGAGKHASHYA